MKIQNNVLTTDMLTAYPNNTLINKGDAGEWDESIREIGNIVYSEKLQHYFFFYSGHTSSNTGQNTFIGVAQSEDGINWQKMGKAFDEQAEDPYVVIHNDTFYMFYEDKSEIPFRKIDLVTSQDGIHFTTQKRGVIEPKGDEWQKTDVSSPAIIKHNDEWVMLYEGRGSHGISKNRGMIGYAHSKDLINWSSNDEPVFKGSFRFYPDLLLKWDNYVVPDDIIKNDDKYVMSYHGYGWKRIWQTGLASSKDLKTWEKLNDKPIHPTSTVMMQFKENTLQFFMETSNKVEFYKPTHAVANKRLFGLQWPSNI